MSGGGSHASFRPLSAHSTRSRATLLLLLGSAALGLVLAVSAPAQAQESGPIVAGTWTFNVKITSSNLPESFEQRSGERTYYFGAGCVLGQPCDIERTNQDGDRIQQTLSSNAEGWTWVTTTPIDCNDTVTGEVSTPHGADFTVTFAFAPTDTVERDGVQYVSAMSGVTAAGLVVNAAGRRDNCTIPPDNVQETHAAGTISAVPVPLSSLGPEASPTPLASAPPPAASGPATVPGFTLPMTAEEARSRLAVARGDRSTVPAALITPGDAVKDTHRLVENLALAALLGLLMVFPAQLFNSTYEQNHERIDAVLARLPRRRPMPAPVAPGEDRGPEVADVGGAAQADGADSPDHDRRHPGRWRHLARGSVGGGAA